MHIASTLDLLADADCPNMDGLPLYDSVPSERAFAQSEPALIHPAMMPTVVCQDPQCALAEGGRGIHLHCHGDTMKGYLHKKVLNPMEKNGRLQAASIVHHRRPRILLEAPRKGSLCIGATIWDAMLWGWVSGDGISSLFVLCSDYACHPWYNPVM